VSQPTPNSKHLKVLEQAGLVERTIEGRVHRFRLRQKPFAGRWRVDRASSGVLDGRRSISSIACCQRSGAMDPDKAVAEVRRRFAAAPGKVLPRSQTPTW